MPLEETGRSRNRKAGEGSVCGSQACQAGGRKEELETLRNVSRPGTQRVESSHGLWGGGRRPAHIVSAQTARNGTCGSKEGELT